MVSNFSGFSEFQHRYHSVWIHKLREPKVIVLEEKVDSHSSVGELSLQDKSKQGLDGLLWACEKVQGRTTIIIIIECSIEVFSMQNQSSVFC